MEVKLYFSNLLLAIVLEAMWSIEGYLAHRNRKKFLFAWFDGNSFNKEWARILDKIEDGIGWEELLNRIEKDIKEVR